MEGRSGEWELAKLASICALGSVGASEYLHGAGAEEKSHVVFVSLVQAFKKEPPGGGGKE